MVGDGFDNSFYIWPTEVDQRLSHFNWWCSTEQFGMSSAFVVLPSFKMFILKPIFDQRLPRRYRNSEHDQEPRQPWRREEEYPFFAYFSCMGLLRTFSVYFYPNFVWDFCNTFYRIIFTYFSNGNSIYICSYNFCLFFCIGFLHTFLYIFTYFCVANASLHPCHDMSIFLVMIFKSFMTISCMLWSRFKITFFSFPLRKRFLSESFCWRSS